MDELGSLFATCLRVRWWLGRAVVALVVVLGGVAALCYALSR
jgi:hypothetical protein